MRGSESEATSSPVISLSCDSTLRVRPLMASPSASQLHELLTPVQYRELLVVQEGPAQPPPLLLRRPARGRGEGDLHGGALPLVLVRGRDHRDVLATQPVFQGA